MTDAAQPIFRVLDQSLKEAGERINELRESNRQTPDRISEATKKRTDALVELAKHYLPDLTHQTLGTAWEEVRGKIRDVMLLRDDACRRYHAKLDEAKARRDEFESQFKAVQIQQEKARLDLLSKQGNFRKSIRVDPRIETISRKIDAIDAELQKTISTLELANTNANEKLPDYQACELFNYLKERQYGTPQYTAKGIERRWDRWIAKMVDYRQSHANYRHLTETPIRLSELIREKEQLYRHWIKRLEEVRKEADRERAEALARFGITEQKRLWKSLGEQAESLEAEWEEAGWDVSIIESDLETACSIHGEQHEEAVRIYAEFLDKVEPEILRVYATCTESPIDDQIAARIRDFESEVKNAQRISEQQRAQIIEQEKLRAALSELAANLRAYLRQHSIELELRADFQFDAVVDDLSQWKISPDKAWRLLQAAIIDPNRPTLLTRGFFQANRHHEATPDWDTLDVAFTNAANEPAHPRSGTTHGPDPHEESDSDASSISPSGPSYEVRTTPSPSEIQVYPASSDKLLPDQPMFRPLAITYHRENSDYIETLLAAEGLACFAHRDQEDFSDIEIHEPGAITVLVELDEFNEARRIVIEQLRQLDAPWDCSHCRSAIDKGYHQCWRCGNAKS